MVLERYNYLGNTNIGFYATFTGSHGIYPPEFQKSDVFEVDGAETYIAKTRLVGLFTAGNSRAVLLPDVATERERKKLDDAGIEYATIESRDTALGNLVIANDHGAVISTRLEEQREEIEEALGVDTETVDIAGTPMPGACGVANSRGVLLHRDVDEETAEKVKEVLQVEEVGAGTVNMGSPYVGSGILANDTSILVGEDTTGPEIGRIDRALL